MPYVDDLFLPQIPSAVACQIAEIDAATLKNWISRKPFAVMLTDQDRVEAGQSTRFRFNIRRVLQIRITADLVRMGLGPRHAAMMAAGFTDFGTNRSPGELFPTGQTLLLAVEGAVHGKVVNVKPDESWREVLRRARPPGEFRGPTVIVDANETVFHVRKALGLPRIFPDQAA